MRTRVPSGAAAPSALTPRHPALDGLRGVAVLLVLFDHGGFGSGRPVGGAGVAVFFVISGFLITTLLRRDLSAGSFSYAGLLGSRVVRLYPGLLLMVAVTAVAALLTGAGRALLVEVPAAVLYVQDLLYPLMRGSLYDHTWSLAVEEQFYLLWPFVLPLVLRRRRVGLALLALAAVCSVIARLALTAGGAADAAYADLVTNAFALLIGCGIAVTGAHFGARRRGAAIAAAAAIGLAAAAPLMPVPYIDGPVLAAVAAGILLVAVLPGAAPLETAPLRFLGRISYSVYLWQWPLLLTGTRWTGLGSLAAIAAAIGIATASSLLLEEPLRAAGARHRRRAVPAAEPLGAAAVVE